MQSGEQRGEERRTRAPEEPTRETSEGRRRQGASRDRERAEMARLAAELLVDEAQRHHGQRPVVGLPRRGPALLDPVQRLAKCAERLARRPQQRSGTDRVLVLPDEWEIDGGEIQQHPRERRDQGRKQERKPAARPAFSHQPQGITAADGRALQISANARTRSRSERTGAVRRVAFSCAGGPRRSRARAGRAAPRAGGSRRASPH